MAEAREMISTNRFGGILTVWKGAWGFIEPSTNIKHADAEMNGGKVFVHKNDLGDLKVKKGCSLSFMVYTDGKGLGAMEVRMGKKQPTKETPAKGAAKGNGKTVVKGKGKSVQATPVRKVIQTIQKKGSGKGGKKGAVQQVQKAPVGATIDKSNRVRLSKGRLMGTILKLKGNIGWIQPDSKIPGATKDSLFLHKADFKSSGQPLAMGCRVDFFVYQDESGLGAEHCRITPGSAQPQQLKKMKQPVQQVAKKPMLKTFTKQQLMVKTKGAGKGGKANGKGSKGAKGPPVKKPRKRVGGGKKTGEVLEWKGKFGWVAAHDSIDHPEASKHDGKIYVSMADLKGGKKELSVGQTVEFFCYADGNGIGAEQVRAM